MRCDGQLQHRRALRAEDGARAALPRRVGGEDGGGAARAVARRPGGLQRARARRLRPERRRRHVATVLGGGRHGDGGAAAAGARRQRPHLLRPAPLRLLPAALRVRRPLPLAVHTTYQYGDAAEFAYGKRARLQQAGLWRADDGGDAASASSPCASRPPRRRRGDVQPLQPLGGISCAAARPRRRLATARDLATRARHCPQPHSGAARRPLLLRPQLGRDACLPRARRRCDAAAIRVPDRPPARAPCLASPESRAMAPSSLPPPLPPHRAASVQRVAFARSGARRRRHAVAAAGRDDAALRTALTAAGADAAEVLEVDPETLDGALCGFAAAGGELRSLRKRRGSSASRGCSAWRRARRRASCTARRAALASRWRPAGWRTETARQRPLPVRMVGARARFARRRRWRRLRGGVGRRGRRRRIGVGGGRGASGGGAERRRAAGDVCTAAGVGGVRGGGGAQRTPQLACVGGEGGRRRARYRALGLKRVSALSAELGVAHVQLPAAASGGWAAAAACVAFGAAWIEHEGRSVVLASPHVVWLRAPRHSSSARSHRRRRRRRRRRVARVRPGGAGGRARRVGDVLSVKQDALFGAGFAKWGAFDPSVLVLRASAGGRAFAQRGRAPSKPRRRRRPRAGGRSARGTASLSGRGAWRGVAWPHRAAHPRRTPELAALRSFGRPSAPRRAPRRRVCPWPRVRRAACPLSPRRRALLCASSARAAPHVPARERRRPPPPSRRRLALARRSGAARAATPPSSTFSRSTSGRRPPTPGAPVAGRARGGAASARALRDGRRVPSAASSLCLRCAATATARRRAPSPLRLGCRLPSAESEAYLLACAPDHLLRADAWADDASAGGARLLDGGVRRWRLPERRVAVHACAPSGAPPAADGLTACAGATGEQLARAIRADAPVLELPWTAERRPLVGARAPTTAPRSTRRRPRCSAGPLAGGAVRRRVRRGAAGQVRAVAVVDGERFCLDFGKLRG